MKWVGGCLKKAAYFSEGKAWEVAVRRTRATGIEMTAYVCSVGHWHIGKAGTGE